MRKPHDQLTEADRKLLEALCNGERPKQLAHAMGLSLPAVSQRLRVVTKVLGAKSRYQAVAMYVEKHRMP